MRRRSVHSVILWILTLAWLCIAPPGAWAAGNMDSTNKHTWTENAGWCNVAPVTGGVTNGVTLYFDGTGGYLTGYTWGENIGWIKLGDNTGGPYQNNSATDWGVNLAATSNFSGYAWGENVGWIKFDPAYGGVTIDMVTGRFDGYAWGENIGWLRFQGTAPDYSVRTVAFDTQPLGTPNWWLTLHNVGENYDDGDNMSAWQEYVADTDPTNPASWFGIASISNLPAINIYFPSSSSRYYTLQKLDNLQSGNWSNVVTQTGIQGSGGADSLQDTSLADAQFYRVQVKVSP